MKWFVLSLLTITVLSSSFATAADKKKKAAPITDPEVLFKNVDGDSNGKLTLEEFKQIKAHLPTPKVKKNEKAPPEVDLEKIFTQLDRNSDKVLLMDEFKNLSTLVPLTAKKK